jgi:hypothetical protein
MKAPTSKQADKLRVLGSGAIALAPGRGDWGPLLRRGWVETVDEDDKSKRFLPPVRITPAGLMALAAALERDGQVEMAEWPKQRSEAPHVTEFREKLDKVRAERDEAQREASRLRSKMASAKRALEGAGW